MYLRVKRARHRVTDIYRMICSLVITIVGLYFIDIYKFLLLNDDFYDIFKRRKESLKIERLLLFYNNTIN